MTEPNNSSPPTDNSTLWDANDVASFLKVSRSWVYHRAESGELPHLRVGGLLRFEPRVILSFARGERAPKAKALPLRASLLEKQTPSR
jgi:excisionase family DNA binding protein